MTVREGGVAAAVTTTCVVGCPISDTKIIDSDSMAEFY
jgi:phosphoribosylcarboxyaminoimidazole (NCAIR) mutase